MLFAWNLRAGPIRILFLGHDKSEHHNSNEYYPLLAKAGQWRLTKGELIILP